MNVYLFGYVIPLLFIYRIVCLAKYLLLSVSLSLTGKRCIIFDDVIN